MLLLLFTSSKASQVHGFNKWYVFIVQRDSIFVCVCVCVQLQQKHAEVVEALQMFQDGVQAARNHSTLQCQTTLLEKLEYIITNHLDIVSSLQIQVSHLKT